MNYYEDIKRLLINQEITRKVKINSINRSELNNYLLIGKMLDKDKRRYGEKIILVYSKKLTNELGKSYSKSNLYNMINYYKLSIKEIFQTVIGKLSWSHYIQVFSMNDDSEKIYYINKAINNNLSVRQLKSIIKQDEYHRLPEETRNKIISNKHPTLLDEVQEPILIKSNVDIDKISEKHLQNTIVENITDFMKQLGECYSFIDSEYPIKLGNKYNYIDILLYNIKYKCYVVVELKVTELTKDHIGQIQIYMNYIDTNIKTIDENNTVGIIICKYNNQYIIKYCSDNRIISREFILN